MPRGRRAANPTGMLILDLSRALDRMIWTAGRHAVVVPEPFSSAGAPPTAPVPTSLDEPPWVWREASPAVDRDPRRLASAVELGTAARRAS